jgi:hypothetical protein
MDIGDEAALQCALAARIFGGNRDLIKSKRVHSELLGAQIGAHCSWRNLETDRRLREQSKSSLLAIRFDLV